MDFTYSNFWINKCAGYNENEQLLSEINNVYKKHGYDEQLLFDFVKNKYDFVALGLNQIYKSILLKKIKFKIKSNNGILTGNDNFILFWKNKIINSSIQQLLRKIVIESINGTVDDLASIINEGYSYSWNFHKSYRTESNFKYSDIAFIDIDNDVKFLNLTEVKQDSFIKKYACIVHASSSYTESKLRCRVIFQLENRIDDVDNFKYLLRGLAYLFNSDTSLNADKSMYGSNRHTQLTTIYKNNFLPQSKVDKLINSAKNTNINNSKCSNVKIIGGKKTTKKLVLGLQSGCKFACNSTLQDLYLQRKFEFFWHHDIIRLQSVASLIPSSKTSSSFLCALHNDRNPSAYIVRQSNSTMFRLGCHVPDCGAFINRRVTPLTYKEKSSKTIFNGTLVELQSTIVNSIARLPIIPVINNIDTLQIIRAPKGSGKTFQLEQVSRSFQSQNLSILAITHLISLSVTLSNRLNLDNYQNFTKGYTTNKFVCCINSLPYYFNSAIIKGTMYDCVIIDEFEQVINTLFYADYFSPQARINILQLINHFIVNAKYVFLLDADAGKLSKNYANIIKENRNRHLDIYFYDIDLQYKKDIYICTHKYKVYYEILRSVDNNERIIIVANRRSETSNIYYRLKILYFKSKGSNLSILRIDGSTANEARSIAFLKDPTKEAAKYQVLIYNQKIMTGISIDCKGHFSKIFGIFNHTIYKGSISNVTSNLQMLSRHRNNIPACIFIEYSTKLVSKDIKNPVVYSGIAKNNLLTKTFKSFSEDLHEVYSSNINDYYMEHISQFLESGYNIAILNTTVSEKCFIKKYFIFNVKIFYDLTEYNRDRIKTWNSIK